MKSLEGTELLCSLYDDTSVMKIISAEEMFVPLFHYHVYALYRETLEEPQGNFWGAPSFTGGPGRGPPWRQGRLWPDVKLARTKGQNGFHSWSDSCRTSHGQQPAPTSPSKIFSNPYSHHRSFLFIMKILLTMRREDFCKVHLKGTFVGNWPNGNIWLKPLFYMSPDSLFHTIHLYSSCKRRWTASNPNTSNSFKRVTPS